MTEKNTSNNRKTYFSILPYHDNARSRQYSEKKLSKIHSITYNKNKSAN